MDTGLLTGAIYIDLSKALTPSVITYKYLGLALNSTLNMSEHVISSLKRVSSRVKLLKKTRPFLDTKTSALIFSSMIVQILTYSCLATFGSISETLKRKTKELEHRAQKIIGMNVKIPSSSKIVSKRVVTYVHKCLNGSTNSIFENYFTLQSSRINTRNNGHLVRLSRVKLEVARSSFFFQGAIAFNELPINLRKEKDILKFKSLLKQW